MEEFEEMEEVGYHIREAKKYANKIGESSTLRTQLSYAHKAYEVLLEIQENFPSNSQSKTIQKDIKNLSTAIKILPVNSFITKANKSEENGNDRQTIKHLKEALRLYEKEGLNDEDFRSIFSNQKQWRGLKKSLINRLNELDSEPEERLSKELIITYSRSLNESTTKVIKFKSPDSGKSYNINTKFLSCSCPDFQKGRSEFNVFESRRYCKHMRQTLFNMFPDVSFLNCTDFVKKVIASNFSKSLPRGISLYHCLIEGNEVVITVNRFCDYYSVFTREINKEGETIATGEINEYHFDLYQKTWDDEVPHNSKIIRTVLVNEIPIHHFNLVDES